MVLPGFAQLSYVSRRFLKEPIAQPVEHLTFNQRVDGSNPSGLTNKIKNLNDMLIFESALGVTAG